MDTLYQDDFTKLGSHSDHVIMSDGLDLDLGEPLTIDQSIEIGDSKFVCSVLRAKITNLVQDDETLWEFDVEIPGFSLLDVLHFDTLTFHYNNITFNAMRELELNLAQSSSPIVTFIAKRIINNNE